jgi:hypothetical protein
MRSIHPWALRIGTFALCLMTVDGMAQAKAPDNSPQSETSAPELPDSPGTTWARLQESAQQSSAVQSTADAPVSSSTQRSSTQTQTPQDRQPGQNQQPAQNEKMQRPVGTAAAEAPKVSGVTAAQPAGVAIAPAKQRRVRILVLKMGAILGAGAAIGTVVALSAATPSKPPGAH